MSRQGWKYAFASTIGTSHERLNLPCQDASACRVLHDLQGEEVLVAVVSDGAGSASRSEVGAQLACSLLVEEIESLLASGGEILQVTKNFVTDWLIRFNHEVSLRAEAEDLRPRDFACTLAAALVGTNCAVFFQIGDGVIVVSSEDERDHYNWIFWPAEGEYANMTFFATDQLAAANLAWDKVDRRIEEIAILSDGLQRLALHYQTQTAHPPFFRPLLAVIRNTKGEPIENLSSKLDEYLSSSSINERTDDDKTLILATRRERESSSDSVPA